MLARARHGDHNVAMTKKFETSWGGKAAVAAGAAIGSAAIAAAVLYARKTMRKDVPAEKDVHPVIVQPPETD